MNLPTHITRQQLTDAFAAMGLDAGAVVSWYGRTDASFIVLEYRPADSPSVVEFISAKIPIVDEAPPQEADLLGELRSEGGAG